MKFKNKNKSFGFTLVELLVVIAIIGILSSVAIINLQFARDKAKRALILSELGQNLSAIQTCFADKQNLTPPPAGSNPDYSIGGGAICNGSSATWPIVNREDLDYYYYVHTGLGAPDFKSDYSDGSFYITISDGIQTQLDQGDVAFLCEYPNGSRPICHEGYQ